jgi:hypothetical protein
MVNGNLLHNDNKYGDFRRFKVYYDGKPPTAADAEKRVCLALKSTGQVIRLSEVEAYDLMAELVKALKWGHRRRHH